MTEGSKQRLYRKPEIVIDQEGRSKITKVAWNHDTMAQHVVANGLLEWIEVEDLARLVWGRKTETSCRAVKRRLPGLKRHLALTYNHLLVVEYSGPRGSASAMKIYDPTIPTDVQAMTRMMQDMASRRDRMLTYYEKITGLSGLRKELR